MYFDVQIGITVFQLIKRNNRNILRNDQKIRQMTGKLPSYRHRCKKRAEKNKKTLKNVKKRNKNKKTFKNVG